MLVALLCADAIIVAFIVLFGGPVFMTGRDAFGRPLDNVSRTAKTVFAVFLVVVVAYLGVQGAAVARFLPYLLDPGTTSVEHVVRMSLVDAPLADDGHVYWVTTQTHRFGVTSDIYHNLSVGDLVSARYRPGDDTLYSITVIEYADGTPASPSPSPSP
jgi:hypothetical protein